MLEKITNWFKEQFAAMWEALAAMLHDLVLWFVGAVFDISASMIEMLPAPDFMTGMSIGQMMGQAGPVVGWLANVLQIPAALGVFGAAYAFRILRKFLTLFQW